MNILGIDTCCMTATAAIMSDDRLVAQVSLNNKKTHSQTIMPMIEYILEQAETDINDIDCFAAATGPGSFTGVRIGVAAIKAMAHATGKPCASVSTLEALACNVSEFDGIICPIMDARRGQVYNALFKGMSLERICDDRALAMEELISELNEIDEKVIFLGDGLPVYAGMINEKLKCSARFADRPHRFNLAASVAELGYNKYLFGDVVGYAELKPEYHRLSQAERERMEKIGGVSE